MKKVLLVVLLIFVFCSMSTAEIKDSPDGFRGIKWGQSPAALGSKRTLLVNEGKLSGYLRSDDKLKIGDAELTGIVYAFWDNKFMMATFFAEGFSNSKALKAAMIARYGEPDLKPEEAMGNYVWHDDNVMITYEYKTDELKASALIGSRAIMKIEQDQEEAAAQKGVKDF